MIDDDLVDQSNLQRQVIHSDARIGMDKVQSAQIAMQALNPFIEVRPYKRRLTQENAAQLIGDHDLVLDGSDNFDTRYLVNRICVALEKPLIAGAITQWEGQIGLYDPAQGGPCYACVFPRPAGPRHGSGLCRGRGSGPFARSDRGDDGDGGSQASDAGGRNIARTADAA